MCLKTNTQTHLYISSTWNVYSLRKENYSTHYWKIQRYSWTISKDKFWIVKFDITQISVISKLINTFNTLPIKMPPVFFFFFLELEKLSIKLIWKKKEARIDIRTFKKKHKKGRLILKYIKISYETSKLK